MLPPILSTPTNTDPIYFIPLFFRSGSPTRLAICLLVHPVLLEAGEAVGRGTKGDAVALALRTGEILSYEEAAAKIIEDSIEDSVFKLIMAFSRRFMLLNMGSAQATMFAVVAASIEEASDSAVPRRVCVFLSSARATSASRARVWALI